MCGATIAKHVANGNEVAVLVLADGVTSRENYTNDDLHARELMLTKAKVILGYQILYLTLDLPDNQLDTIPILKIIKIIEKRINEFKPDMVITHYLNDLNIDHQIVANAVMVACRPLGSVKEIYFGEVQSSTEWAVKDGFTPNVFVDISETFEKKMSALHCYESEMREWPHPRSYEAIKSLAQWRGATVCIDKAEAFMLGRLAK